ncbi:TPA: DUF1351 domain-containing protein [Streptococcus agalactiae]|uniref:DUF1351 domain-containing protein n=1 Tax=Streptococcus agalactiae TaxID=1311 RepID=UPI000D6FA944|nr:DUF1351 domain-containing protein [Streptococcus agalactiae]PWT25381.1 hypothetical protein CUZ34_01250 [Streptococcus agalactiae]HEN3143883.1 DUF1351 domain-containing protein [Streptococcus agalactiae]
MVKDVTVSNLTNLNVGFKPAEIQFDFDEFEKKINAAVATFQGLEMSVENYQLIKDNITTYKSLYDALETSRKQINNDITKPYKDFKALYDQKIEPLEKLLEDLRKGRDEIDAHELQLRLDVIRVTFEEKAQTAEFEKDKFAELYKNFGQKKYFKQGKLDLKQETIDEIDEIVLAEYDKVQEFNQSVEMINETADDFELLPGAYIKHLENGATVTDIIKMMREDRKAKKLEDERRLAQQQADAERKAEIERLAAENANANIKAYDADTGEILEDGTFSHEPSETIAEVPNFEPSDPVTKILKITSHIGQSQIDALYEYLEDNFINYEELGE